MLLSNLLDNFCNQLEKLGHDSKNVQIFFYKFNYLRNINIVRWNISILTLLVRPIILLDVVIGL